MRGPDSTWAILEGQITIAIEATSHEKTGETGGRGVRVSMSREAFSADRSRSRPR